MTAGIFDAAMSTSDESVTAGVLDIVTSLSDESL